MTKLRWTKSKEIDRLELEKHLKQDTKSEQNPKGGFRQKRKLTYNETIRNLMEM